MLTGLKGVKYGLQPGAKPKTKPALRKPINVFGDDDDDGTIGQDIARHAEKKLNDKKVTQMHAAALAEDASVFDYDGVYDSIQEARVQPRQQEKLARKSRYIEGLLDKAKEREREQDIIYERTLLKERAAEDHLFGDKDKFVTAAYKKKLEEDQKWLAAERIREARDAKADVVKAGHMGNFYRNVMTNNAAFGTAQPAPAAPGRPAAASEPAAGEGTPAADPSFEAARRAREAYEAAKERGGAAASASAPQQPQADSSRQETGSGRFEAGGEKREKGAASRERDTAEPSSRDDGARGVSGAARDEGKLEKEAAGGVQGKGDEAPAAAEAAAAEKPPEEDKEAKAAAARERFLARKRKAPPA
ncbi:hypothetical protein COCSUDRAFT_66132 [Coccomyxa subellipsoidea C-169]|uniref:Nuclear speckle splicing regulatory protein 1 N-terminal domain-containing protein n=1 Tax=Coccomyxa subellipsoidea (strain C-169) TaxID=574566 RepID=I0YX81_COCSC|nr:hypothetical protein COCSUDRAFT_66132 [Coccomyxa subellipsoidea C-169]EIE23000.1 hypothetical protein COCSUDRAFT_66132 [Coccomyxa subellipsoidea C-169]|eukprot:XP_005647544.1 hypothetical protein COCSUDRAFT_66132 [Coccomyxa subellipsoidea C-169]